MQEMFAAQTPRRPTRLQRAFALVALGVAVTLAGCAPATTTSGGKSAATPAPTATSAPRTLYQADWTHRAGEWKLPPHWSIVNGALQNDGQSSDVLELPIPYQVTSQNYTLSVQMLTLAANGPGVNDEYGFLGRSPAGKLLYTAELTEVQQSLHSYAVVYPANPDNASSNGNYGTGNNFGSYDFTPGRSTRPYVVQVEGPYVSFTAGNGFIGQVKSVDQLAPASLVIVDQNVQLVIESLTITTP
jgi:hypothetical protein